MEINNIGPISTILARAIAAAGDVDYIENTFNPPSMDLHGNLYVQLVAEGGGGEPFSIPGLEAVDALATRQLEENNIPVISLGYTWNDAGAVFNRFRGNQDFTVLASAARTVQTNSADFTNYNSKGVHVRVNVSVVAAAGSLTPVIQGLDTISGVYYDILVGAAITTTGMNVIKVYPGIGIIANGSAADILPLTWRVQMRVTNGDSYTYSVGASLIL